MNNRALIFLLVLPFLHIVAQQKSIISGTVRDGSGAPLPLATVYIPGSPDGSVANERGQFVFRTARTGKAAITATLIGYGKVEQEILIAAGQKHTVEIVMEESVIRMKEAVVTASSFASVKEKGVVMSKMDVLMTPGGAADVFQSLKTLPGLTQVSESAELYVRGGEALETITILDGAVMYHPFTFESNYGGLFSNMKTAFVKGLFFSSGGFSAKYGNALSGVLDVETKGPAETRNVNLGISMANGSVLVDYPIIPSAMGLTLQYDRSFTAPIFWLNGGSEKFTVAPRSENFTSLFSMNYSKTGKVKILTISAEDKQGVNVERAEFNGVFDGNTSNKFYALQGTDILFGNIIIKNSLSLNTYTNTWKLGILDLNRTDKAYNYRLDLEKALLSTLGMKTGFEAESREVLYEGVIPGDDYNIRPGGEASRINASITGTRFAGYAEIEALNAAGLEGFGVSAGIRYDRVPKLNLGWANPRMNLSYKLSETSRIMAAFGVFNQLPDTRLFAKEDGNPNLRPMKAVHSIAAYTYSVDDENSFRIEIYNKEYSSLPLEDKTLNYTNAGYGRARGLDLIARGRADWGLSGWLSYGYISARRYWMDYSRETNASTDITHNLALVLKYSFSPYWQIGANIKYATGRPFTPIAGAVYDTTYGFYEPLEGETNAARFPDYKRVDVRVTHFATMFTNLRVVFFLEGLNILDLNNIFGYTYSPDYVAKKEIKSYFGRRMLVMGMNVMF